MNNIFVGNLSFESTKEDVKKFFETMGTVAGVLLMKGKKGKSRGYGFVDMPDEGQKNAAIAALNGKEFMGRVVSVSQLVPKVKKEKKAKHKHLKPYRTDDREAKTWGNSEKKFNPFRKDDRREKPYRRDDKKSRSESASKPPYKKSEGPAKSWPKKEGGFKVKPGGALRVFQKRTGAPKPWPKKRKESD